LTAWAMAEPTGRTGAASAAAMNLRLVIIKTSSLC
jgi:hypothetical protein